MERRHNLNSECHNTMPMTPQTEDDATPSTHKPHSMHSMHRAVLTPERLLLWRRMLLGVQCSVCSRKEEIAFNGAADAEKGITNSIRRRKRHVHDCTEDVGNVDDERKEVEINDEDDSTRKPRNFKRKPHDIHTNHAPKEQDQISLDVARAFPHLSESSGIRKTVNGNENGDSEPTLEPRTPDARRREELLPRLEYLLRRLFNKYPFLNYYQGFHDVCGFILIMFDGADLDDSTRNAMDESTDNTHTTTTMLENMASAIALTRCRDYMCSDFRILQATLQIADRILSDADKALYDHLTQYHILPSITSWLITLFTHDIHSLDILSQIWDHLLSRPPHDMIYFSVALLLDNRSRLLSLEDEGDLFMAVKRLPKSAFESTYDVECVVLIMDHVKELCPWNKYRSMVPECSMLNTHEKSYSPCSKGVLSILSKKMPDSRRTSRHDVLSPRHIEQCRQWVQECSQHTSKPLKRIKYRHVETVVVLGVGIVGAIAWWNGYLDHLAEMQHLDEMMFGLKSLFQ